MVAAGRLPDVRTFSTRADGLLVRVVCAPPTPTCPAAVVHFAVQGDVLAAGPLALECVLTLERGRHDAGPTRRRRAASC